MRRFLKERGVNAGIAQLVEHDLAKVGVASSSLVSRSTYFTLLPYPGGEMVDTQDLKSCDCEVVRVQVPLRVHIWLTIPSILKL